MSDEQKKLLIENMTDNLPVLRKKLGISQQNLADMIGISRSTLISIENRKHTMSWSYFLSFLLLFTKNKETDKLLNVLGIYTDELNDFIKMRRVDDGK